jgi:hypothetical protein
MTDLIVVPQTTNWQRLKGLVLDSVSSPITRRGYADRPFPATSPLGSAQKLGKGICVVRLPNSFGSPPHFG